MKLSEGKLGYITCAKVFFVFSIHGRKLQILLPLNTHMHTRIHKHTRVCECIYLHTIPTHTYTYANTHMQTQNKKVRAHIKACSCTHARNPARVCTMFSTNNNNNCRLCLLGVRPCLYSMHKRPASYVHGLGKSAGNCMCAWPPYKTECTSHAPHVARWLLLSCALLQVCSLHSSFCCT
jgi:hypothetical protein